MDARTINEIRNLANRFMDREDISIALANQIEGLILEEFSDVDFFDDLLLSLSLYCPGGGEHLVNEEVLSQELYRVLIHLDNPV